MDAAKIIKEDGLCRMARNHVHMAMGLPGNKGVISGMRVSCDFVFEVNMIKAKFNGLPFLVSNNGVVLSPGEGERGIIAPKYFRSIFCLKNDMYMY